MSMSMKSLLFAAALVLGTSGAVVTLAQQAPAPQPKLQPNSQPVANARPRIEAVFVLDTTGSMGGLIQAAKENIWSIASSMAQAQPTPELAIGLVAFRDRGDAYVTRVVDLSTDLDSVYAQLMDFRAEGGGDTPEAVAQALHDAVQQIGWSDRQDVYRTVFLVGDAPAQQYPDEPGLERIVADATARGIVVNTIQAGSDGSTRSQWQQVAKLGGGAFFDVAQSGDAIAVTTRYDDRIAELAHQLDDTRIWFGDEEAREKAEARDAAADKLHAAASPAAQAKRAAFNLSAAGRANRLGDNELVDAVTSGTVALEALPPAALPVPMQAMSVEQRKAEVAKIAERRKQLEGELAELSRQRQADVQTQLAERADREESLDYRLFETIKAQAADKGLSYEAAAPVN